MAVNDYTARTGSIRQPLELESVIDLGAQIADALDAAHREGVIHRDVTPSNILVTLDGQAKIVDFGLARIASRIRGGGETSAQWNEGGWGIRGSVTHMSPEQTQGLDLDARTDLFSLGTVLYEIAPGRRAFRGATEHDILEAIVERDPIPPGRINPALPAELDPPKRYQLAAELGDALRATLDHGGGR